MATISATELKNIQLFIAKTIEELDFLELTLNIDDNLWNWKALLSDAPKTIGISKPLDPALNNLGNGNAFWIYLTSKTGKIIGCQADRLIITDDLVGDDVATHRLFGNLRPTIHHDAISVSSHYPLICGRVNFGGGAWIHPEWRGKSLGGVMSRLGRAIAVRHFLIDYFTTFMVSGRKFGVECGFKNKCQIIEGPNPFRNSVHHVDLLWECRREILERIEESVSYTSKKEAA